MRKHDEGFNIIEINDLKDILNNIDDKTNIYVYDSQFDCHDFVTGLYMDDEGDLIIRIGDDGIE